MLEHLEQQKKLTTNQWKIFAAATIGDMLDYFDFLLIAFVLAFIVKDWHLTYGQSAAILLSSGVSAPLGSLIWGWVADKIGRRKVIIATILNFSIATGLMALTPDNGWIFLVVCRFLVGFGVTGLYTVDIAVVQEFVPASRRGWIPGVTTTMLPAGFILGAVLGQYLEAYVRLARPVRDRAAAGGYEPPDPRLGSRIGALADPRGSPRGGAPISRLGVDGRPKRNSGTGGRSAGREGCLARIVQVSAERRCRVSDRPERDRNHRVRMWQVTLFVMVLHVNPAEASGLVIWLSHGQIVGRFFCSWLSDAIGRRIPIGLTCAIAGVTMSLAGYWNDRLLGRFSVSYLMIMVQQFFGSGGYSIIGPYMAEIWPSRLRASRMGLAYGAGNRGKFIGPAGLAVIAGSSNFVSPQATADALIPAINYFAVWYALALVAVLFIGFETRGRTIGEIGSTLTARRSGAAAIKAPAAP